MTGSHLSTAAPIQHGVRYVGAVTAVEVSMPVFIVLMVTARCLLLTSSGDAFLMPGAIALAATGSATIVRACLAPARALRTARSAKWLVTVTALMTVVLGALSLGVALHLHTLSLSTTDPEPLVHALAVGLGLGLVGLLVFGIPAILIILPHAVAWVRLMRLRVGASGIEVRRDER